MFQPGDRVEVKREGEVHFIGTIVRVPNTIKDEKLLDSAKAMGRDSSVMGELYVVNVIKKIVDKYKTKPVSPDGYYYVSEKAISLLPKKVIFDEIREKWVRNVKSG